MAEPKTKMTDVPVEDFLDSIKDDQTRKDCWTIVDIMEKATKAKARMWGSNIVGFGAYQYIYASGREGTWMLTAFAPRKKNITLYIASGFEGYDELRNQLGAGTGGGQSCIYIKRLSDIHVPTLKKLVAASVKHMISSHSQD